MNPRENWCRIIYSDDEETISAAGNRARIGDIAYSWRRFAGNAVAHPPAEAARWAGEGWRVFAAE